MSGTTGSVASKCLRLSISRCNSCVRNWVSFFLVQFLFDVQLIFLLIVWVCLY